MNTFDWVLVWVVGGAAVVFGLLWLAAWYLSAMMSDH